MKFKIFCVVIASAALVTGCGTASNTANVHDPADHAAMDHSSMNHNTSGDAAANSNSGVMHHAMMKSDPDAAKAPYDLQFIDTMVAHHEGAVEMANVALKKTSNPELKAFAQQIIADQNKEIGQMKAWRDQWYKTNPPAKNMEMAGMADSMRKMMEHGGMEKLTASSGKEFDTMFLDMMIPHHEGALEMSNYALKRAEHSEIKTLAGQIIKAQKGEIDKMKGWKSAWNK